MILFFGDPAIKIFAVQTDNALHSTDISKLTWLFGNQPLIKVESLSGLFVGPRATMISPWSNNAVEITQNKAIGGIRRMDSVLTLAITTR